MYLAEEASLRRRVDAVLPSAPNLPQESASQRIRNFIEKLEVRLASSEESHSEVLSMWIDVVDESEVMSYKVDRISTAIGITSCSIITLNLSNAGAMLRTSHLLFHSDEQYDQYTGRLQSALHVGQINGEIAANEIVETLADMEFFLDTMETRVDATTTAQTITLGLGD